MKHIALFLHDIYSNRKSGRLTFKVRDIEKYFFFRQGNLEYVKTNQAEERLGEVLFRLEKIGRDAHSNIDDYIEPSVGIGEVLIGKGLISEQDLDEALTYQLRETTLKTFPFFDAEIVFQEKELPSSGKEQHRISISFLIEYGIRKLGFQPELKVFLEKKKPVLKKQTLAYLLTEEEKRILEKVDGLVPAGVLAASTSSAPEFFWKSLYLFYCLDLIDLEESASASPPAAESGPGSGRAVSDNHEEPSSLSQVLTMKENLASWDYYRIIGISRGASDDETKKAYFQLARIFHPDRFERDILEKNRETIEEVFDAITNAYRTLSNKEKRREYDLGAGSGRGEDSQDVNKKADTKFRQGKTLYNQERYDEAVTFLDEAVRLRGNKGDYHLLLAMAEARLSSFKKKAEDDFLKAIGLEPWNPEGYVGLALLYKNEGLLTKATKQLRKALEADPEHKVAKHEYDLIVKGGAKKGLRGFFSSKKK